MGDKPADLLIKTKIVIESTERFLARINELEQTDQLTPEILLDEHSKLHADIKGDSD